MSEVSKLNMSVVQGAPANSAAVSKLTMYVVMQIGTEAGGTALTHRTYSYAQRVRNVR